MELAQSVNWLAFHFEIFSLIRVQILMEIVQALTLQLLYDYMSGKDIFWALLLSIAIIVSACE